MAKKNQPIQWNGQEIQDIPLDSLILWTENPRDPLYGKYTNEDVIQRALSKEHEGDWNLPKLAKEMGDSFVFSELPTVVRMDNTSQYIVYDGNRRVILALLSRNGIPVEGNQFELPLFPQNTIPCNVCDKATALDHVLRKHSKTGSWKQIERDIFMHKYMNKEKTVLIRLEELTGMISSHPLLNQGYVEADILNPKHLEEMGLKPDKPDYGIDRELLKELLEVIDEKIQSKDLHTRGHRNDPTSVLPSDLLSRIKDNAKHHKTIISKLTNSDNAPNTEKSIMEPTDEASTQSSLLDTDSSNEGQPVSGRRTREVRPSSIPIFGNGKGLSLKPGNSNNLYRTLESLWSLYEKGKIPNSTAFPAIFRMGLRLLAEMAADECGMNGKNGLKQFIDKYAEQAKSQIRGQEKNKDIVTFLDSQSVTPDNLLKLLHGGAHGYSSTNNVEQARAISILLGYMLTLNRGKDVAPSDLA